MSPEELIDELRSHNAPTPGDLARLERMCRAYPHCAELWICYGDMILLSETCGACEQALACYLRATTIDPRCAEGFESLGYYFDTYHDDFTTAADHFRRAIELGAGNDSRIGLARALAQMGRDTEAFAALDGCDEIGRAAATKLRDEITAGDWRPL